MYDMDIRFVSSNEYKVEEAAAILTKMGVRLRPTIYKIAELQTIDSVELLRDKALRAFRVISRPLVVEHTGLYLSSMNGFPGGLTEVFWRTVGPERFCQLFGGRPDSAIRARTYIGYIDGFKIHIFDGEIEGRIPLEPRGKSAFAWNQVFIPDGYDETFAEMGQAKKNEISMRRIALAKLVEHLRRVNDY